jgi:hypothetical protein
MEMVDGFAGTTITELCQVLPYVHPPITGLVETAKWSMADDEGKVAMLARRTVKLPEHLPIWPSIYAMLPSVTGGKVQTQLNDTLTEEQAGRAIIELLNKS